MTDTVGVAELRRNLSKYLARVKNGERLQVTERNRVVAELGPPPSADSHLDRMIAEGRLEPATRKGLAPPLNIDLKDLYAASKALEYVRGEG